MKTKSVKSINQWQSVIQTSYDIIKAHGGEIRVESLPADEVGNEEVGTQFTIKIPIA